MVDECNIETHGMQPSVGRLAEQSDWEDAHLLRLERLYHRDKRHACVIAWSLGNEAGYGKTHDIMAAWIRQVDPTRILMYEPASYGARDTMEVTNISQPGQAPTLASETGGSVLAPMSIIQAAWKLLFSLSPPISNPTLKANLVATDVVCPMYARVEELVRLSRAFPTFPIIQCEYAHMMGKSLCQYSLNLSW